MRYSETAKVIAPATEAQFWHSLKIDTKRQAISRSRYDFWQLLADLGGFRDGLMMLVGLFVKPLSAISFMQDFSQDSKKQSKSSSKQKLERLKVSRYLKCEKHNQTS